MFSFFYVCVLIKIFHWYKSCDSFLKRIVYHYEFRLWCRLSLQNIKYVTIKKLFQISLEHKSWNLRIKMHWRNLLSIQKYSIFWTKFIWKKDSPRILEDASCQHFHNLNIKWDNSKYHSLYQVIQYQTKKFKIWIPQNWQSFK